MKRTFLAAAAALLALTGCAAEPETDPDTVVSIVILKETWDEYSIVDQYIMCVSWIDDTEGTLDKFFSVDTPLPITRDEARAFFDYECSK